MDKVAAATALVRERRPDLPVEGPIQYDAAVDPAVAATKLPDSEVAGQATVFIFPDLNTGNNTYKAVQRSAGAVAVGPVLQGLRRPVNDLSRGATVQGHRQHGGHHRDPGRGGAAMTPGPGAQLRLLVGEVPALRRRDDAVAKGLVERIGEPGGDAPDHARGAAARSWTRWTWPGWPRSATGWCTAARAFTEPSLIDDEVVAGDRGRSSRSRRCTTRPTWPASRWPAGCCPDVPQVAVFDTAFHATIPPARATYAIDAAPGASAGRSGGTASTAPRTRTSSRRTAELLGRPSPRST